MDFFEMLGKVVIILMIFGAGFATGVYCKMSQYYTEMGKLARECKENLRPIWKLYEKMIHDYDEL